MECYIRIIGVSGLLNFNYFHLNLKRNTQLCNANSVDPDQTPRVAASDLGLHCLPVSHLRGARD